MKFSLIHPSRGRAQKALETALNWKDKASGNNHIEHILSLDTDDTQLYRYKSMFEGHTLRSSRAIDKETFIIIASSNTCVVEATNHAAKEATGDILIYLSDDFDCPENWDELILSKVHTGDWLLRVNDGYQPMDNCVLTIPIMSRSLYENLGYFWFPEYKSMWVDVDLYFTTKEYMIEAPELLFPHNCAANGKSQYDETYKRSEANWNQGVEIFNRRSKEFGWGRAFNKLPA